MNKSIIEIDQSGKIEDTSKDTVLALSNGIQFSILISRKIKPIINFGLVGKGSNSHKLASLVVKKKIKPNLIVTKKELLQTIKMTEVGKQLKST